MKFDLYQTLAIAVVALIAGHLLRRYIKVLVKFCIPAPVIGGVLFSLLTLAGYVSGIWTIDYDDTLKQAMMVFFFTSVGFTCNLKVMKQGGKTLAVLVALTFVIILCQNFISIGVANALGLDRMTGLTAGSIPLIGGHGTSGAFGPILENIGVNGATTLCTAAATFGLIAGSLIGGPVAERLIEKHHLFKTLSNEPQDLSPQYFHTEKDEEEKPIDALGNSYTIALYQLIIAAGIGTGISYLLSLAGLTFPIYIGGLIVGAIMRNISEFSKLYTVHMKPINLFGDYSLSLFLGIAMCTLKLWELWDLALPLILMLTAQLTFMILFAYFIAFRTLGKDYDAAVLTAGICGFGMGATPNAMANIQAVCAKYQPSIKAYLLIPIVGSMFVDFLNSITITAFINF